MLGLFKRLFSTSIEPRSRIKQGRMGDHRIVNQRAQILVGIHFNSRDGMEEEWVDLLTYADRLHRAQCPKCQHEGTLKEFKWNLNHPVSAITESEFGEDEDGGN